MAAPKESRLAVVLDLDGTLIDSIADMVAAANELLDEEGRRPITVEDGRAMLGEGAASLIARAFAASGPVPASDALAGLVARYRAIYARDPLARTTVFPGVFETLAALAESGVLLGVCTNKPHGISQVILAELGLAGHFAAVIGGDALPVRKPDPGHVTAVLDAMGMTGAGRKARKALHVGDSPADVAAARGAGVPVVAVSYGYSRVPPDELGADALIDGFADLPGAMAAMGFRV